MKDQGTVIEEFNGIVNMTASELESWLKSEDSQSAGWPKEDEGGESVGHDSGRKIVAILESNPDKDPEKYTEDQIQHMRKVVSYCKRHLAQEEKANDEKPIEEVKKTKSFASLKNWGHDPLKKRTGSDQDNGDEDKENGQGEKQAGDKRKAADGDSGANKKRQTEKGKSTTTKDEEEKENEKDQAKASNGAKKSNGAKDKEKTDGEEDAKAEADEEKEQGEDEAVDEEEEGADGEDEASDEKEAAKEEADDGEKSGKPAKGPNVGDTVSWNWGNGQPEGKVLDVKADKATIETKRGNEVSRNGDAEDPAVVIDTGKSKAVKSAHELNES
ncbi:hypothetical protein CDD83_10817 [Cordyceps sp. RAO-2017]|nr:hypothetical protein CDD83_10817 [Cordyceps sp. RAO-2017]